MDSKSLFATLSKGIYFNEKEKKDKDNKKIIEEIKENDDNDNDVDAELDFFGNLNEKQPVMKRRKIVNRKKGAKEEEEVEVEEEDEDEESIKRIRKKSHVHIQNNGSIKPLSNFTLLKSKYGYRKKMLEILEKNDIKEPTAVQTEAIPVICANRNLVACAPTGSGKTLAFVLPIFHVLKKPLKEGYRAVVLSPTKELAVQIYRIFQMYNSGLSFRITLLTKATVAGSGSGSSGGGGKKRCDILITTPMRLLHAINAESIYLGNIKTIVFDEADKLFEDNFLEQIDKVISSLPVQKQVCMFSATMPPIVEEISESILINPVRILVGKRNTAAKDVDQKVVFVGSEEGKLLALRQLLQKGMKAPILIFVQSKDRAQQLFKELVYDGINVEAIHGDRTPRQRSIIVDQFRIGKIWVLICTDVVGRGIDFKGVQSVINYDFPQSVTTYIHRVGRTGRAGQKGQAVSFFTEDESELLKPVANSLRESGCEVPEWMLSLKAPSKKRKRQLANHSRPLTDISPIPKYDLKKKQARFYLNKK